MLNEIFKPKTACFMASTPFISSIQIQPDIFGIFEFEQCGYTATVYALILTSQ